MIGFVDLGDVNSNYATHQETDAITCYELVFLLQSVVTVSQIFPLLWKAVATYETQCAIKAVPPTCDGASANRKIYRMHFGLTHDDELKNADTDVVYRTINFFSEDKCYIYFISDPPHLLDTVHNCLNNSGSGKGTHFM